MEEFGVNVVGGCCGTTPEHLKLVVERNRRPSAQPLARAHPPMIAGAIGPWIWCRSRRRCWSASASTRRAAARVKRMVLAEDYDGLLAIARHQVDGGAHALDVQVAVTERGGRGRSRCAVR